MAWASVRPTAATCGSVNVTLGTASPASNRAWASGDDVAGDAGLVLAHVGEQGPAVAVADRVEPAAVDADGAELVVDLDRLAGLQADGLEPE